MLQQPGLQPPLLLFWRCAAVGLQIFIIVSSGLPSGPARGLQRATMEANDLRTCLGQAFFEQTRNMFAILLAACVLEPSKHTHSTACFSATRLCTREGLPAHPAEQGGLGGHQSRA